MPTMRERPWSTSPPIDLPMGSTPGKYFWANASLMTTTRSASVRSSPTDRAAPAKGDTSALEITGRHDSVLGGGVLDVRAFVDAQRSPCTRRRAAAAVEPRRRRPRPEAHAAPARVRRASSLGSHDRACRRTPRRRPRRHPTRTPGWTAYMLATLRASSAAPAAIITASATCATTSPLSKRPPRPSIPPIRAALKHAAQVASIQRDDGHEDDEQRRDYGDRPWPTRTRANLVPSRPTHRAGARPVTTVKPSHARAAPKIPATAATISTSTISCCASRCRFAPSAERTANSADRASTCPSTRAATLAQPIKRISAVAASVASSAGCMGPSTSSRTGVICRSFVLSRRAV